VAQGSVNTCVVGTWEDARKKLLSVASEGQNVYFRGQANAKWPLISSIGRLVMTLAKQHKWNRTDKEAFTTQLEERFLDQFKGAYHRLPGAPILSDQNDELVAFAQHFSLPTPFLDWSRSPYIAAFFAFDGNKSTVFENGHKVAIWAVNWEMLELLLYYEYMDTRPPAHISPDPDHFQEVMKTIRKDNACTIDKIEISGNPNRRMVYQEGLFTRTMKVDDDIEKFVRERSRFAPGTVLTKTVMPGTAQPEVLRDLELMGITPVTLMGNPEGAAATAFNKVLRFRPR
jgi:hypothetical protein